MISARKPILNSRTRYLQIAMNSGLDEARSIITALPRSGRILLEAGTPLIKRYGESGISKIKAWWQARLSGQPIRPEGQSQSAGLPIFPFGSILNLQNLPYKKRTRKSDQDFDSDDVKPYIVADLKTMDRAETEVDMAYRAGATAATVLGHAPIETIKAFIKACHDRNMDSMIDMMNVETPLSVLAELREQPSVVVLHRGVDEERFNKDKKIPLEHIRGLKGRYETLVSVAGGDSVREVQRSMFNDADLVVIWKTVFRYSKDTAELVRKFLAEVK